MALLLREWKAQFKSYSRNIRLFLAFNFIWNFGLAMFGIVYGEVRSIIVLQLGSIPFLLLTAYTNQFYLACGGYLLRQVLMNASAPFYSTIRMKYVDRSLRGFASSAGEAVYHLGWFVAAPISSGLVVRYGSYYGYAYAFTMTAAAFTVISFLFYLWFGKERFQPAEERSAEPAWNERDDVLPQNSGGARDGNQTRHFGSNDYLRR